MRRTVHTALIALCIALTLLVTLNLTLTTRANTPSMENTCKGEVKKTPGEAFTVEIVFKNTGDTKGEWSVNVSFEDGWTWQGTPQILVLNPHEKKTLAWSGKIPLDAPVGSRARLIVYFNSEFKALDWWVLVVSDAQLSIEHSVVK